MNNKTRTPNGSLRSLMSVAGILILNSCSTIPEGATAVQPFEKERYLGNWYEIARMDFRYERNLNNTTANYSLNDNGSIRVENRGYDYTTHKWKSAIGKAKFIGDPTVAKLKVSFFGPFYSGYNVLAIDSGYTYALVAGKSLKYLWILSRNTSIPQDVKQNYLQLAEGLGYDTSALIWVEHNAEQAGTP